MEQALKTLADLLGIVKDASELADVVGRGIRDGEHVRVQDILPEASRIELQGQLKTALAHAKFGPRPSGSSGR